MRIVFLVCNLKPILSLSYVLCLDIGSSNIEDQSGSPLKSSVLIALLIEDGLKVYFVYTLYIMQVLVQVWTAQHIRVGVSLGNQANQLFEDQQYLEAEEVHRIAIQLRKSIFGAHHLDVAKSMNNLACTLIRQSKQEEAIKLQNAVVR